MKVSEINCSNNLNFNGKLILSNGVKENLLNMDKKEILKIRKRLARRPYDIKMQQDSFGYFYATVSHKNGNNALMGPIAIPLFHTSVSQFINSLLKITDTCKK